MQPKFKYKGKNVPCLWRWSANGSITSLILVDILAAVDHFDLINRSTGVQPFLLVDDYGSYVELLFFEYICDPLHLWVVCIGIPYGKILW